MKKVIISTTHKGYNYGTSLQAYASKLFMSKLGYVGELIWYKDFFIKGRDIRIKKIVVMFLRTITSPSLFKKTFFTYKESLNKEISEDSKFAFRKFTEDKLKVKKMLWHDLKKYSRSNNVIASVCGSDQIWNATNIYIDPIYYLSFSPEEKRIAYAPSFGKDQIPKYNKNRIKKNIEKFEFLSIREEQGAKIIKELLGKDVPVMIDPTLLIDKKKWLEECKKNSIRIEGDYILLYFLDNPSHTTIKYIKSIIEKLGCKIISIPNVQTGFFEFDNYDIKNVGPLEFVSLISNAKFVCTDSFHGTAFSANLNIPFLTFKREYGTASDQSSRIVSLLKKLMLSNRYVFNNETEVDLFDISFEISNEVLKNERYKAKTYLEKAFKSINSHKIHGDQL